VEQLRIVVRERRTNTYGMNAVLGALDEGGLASEWSVVFASSIEELTAAIADGLDIAARVLVAWSFYSPDAPAAFREVAATRAEIDDVRITHLAGGVHASAEPERTLRAGFDLVAVGEGESTFVALVDALRHEHPLAGVSGLGYLDGEGCFVMTGGAARPAAARHAVPQRRAGHGVRADSRRARPARGARPALRAVGETGRPRGAARPPGATRERAPVSENGRISGTNR
jgi:radical SAM superfamily enzyme YgiQ (UPF0313 family)